MRTSIGLFIAVALVISLLALPADLSAKEKRGATLIVTRLDGSQVAGELIAVKPDSLLLLSYGGDESIDLADVKTVRIVRKSRVGLFAGLAGAAGTIFGVYWGSVDDELRASGGVLLGIGIFGGLGALAGLTLGLVKGIDTTFNAADESEATLKVYWDKLRGYSREGRLKGEPVSDVTKPEPTKPPRVTAPPIQRPAPPAPPAVPAAKAPPAPPATRTPSRFRLSLSGHGHAGTMSGFSYGDGSFRILDGAAPEQGPHAVSFSQWNKTWNGIFAGLALSLAYSWQERLSAEIELFDLGSSSSGVDGELRYTSSTDGLIYVSTFWRSLRARFTGLLVGLTFRSAVPTAFRRHIIEVGAAAGPTLVRGLEDPFLSSNYPDRIPNPIGRKIILSGRVQAAYDYYLYPGLSVGAFAGYRLMGTTVSGRTASGSEFFFEDGTPQVNLIAHSTEISFPDLPVRASGLYWGLRFGLRL